MLEPAYFADYDDPEATRQKVASGLASILDMDETEVYEKDPGQLLLCLSEAQGGDQRAG